MMLSDLLRKSYAAEFDECWERERTVVRFGRHKRFFAHSALNALIKRSGTGYIGWLTAYQTRRRPREQSSRAAHQNAKRSEDGEAVAGRG
jgi:hypothetical protein